MWLRGYYLCSVMSIAKAYIIDLDGTILDSCNEILAAKLEVLESMGIDAPDPDYLASMNGMRLEDTFILSTGIDEPAIQREAIALYHPAFLDLTLKSLRLFPGVVETLVKLRRRGASIGIMSMRRPEELDIVVGRAGLDQLVDAWVSEYSVPRPKPAPDMIHHLMDRFGVKPDETIVVGDTVYDLEMARDCGARAVGFTLGAQTARMLSTRAPHAIIDNFTALLDL